MACAVALLVACGTQVPEGDASGVELVFTPSPPRVGPVSVELTLTDRAGEPLRGAAVHVEGNMNHAGMVPELASAAETASGRYVAELEFTMGGDWFFVVTAVTPAGESMEHVVHVPGVASEEPGSE